ncbi:reverse transcriptase domain-containing protein [Tanacetum coccineum]
MPMTWSPDVTLVSVKEKNFVALMKCSIIPSSLQIFFDVWGINFMGPFPSSQREQGIYSWRLLDYLSKLIEAKFLPTTTPHRPECLKFLKSLLRQFGASRAYHNVIADPIFAMGQFACLWALKHAMLTLCAGDHRKVQLNELNELRDHDYENSLIYKEKTKRIHDSKIKNRVFNVGDQVLLFNSRLKMFSGKLKSRWSGPFTIAQVFPYGTVELSQNSRPNFKVEGHRN